MSHNDNDDDDGCGGADNSPPTTGTAQQQQQQQHGKPTEGMVCLSSMEDITEEAGNYVEYQTYPSLQWYPALYERAVIEQLLAEQFHQYMSRVKETDCQAELRRLLARGPPIYIQDGHALPLIHESDTHVVRLWFASDGQERSAKLQGAVEGEEREALWNQLKEFIIVQGKEAGDDDDDDNENADDNR